jgi:aspartate racemase
MAKHIGIVAVSAEGAALCYRSVCGARATLLGPHTHPEVTIHTYSLADYVHHIDVGQWN